MLKVGDRVKLNADRALWGSRDQIRSDVPVTRGTLGTVAGELDSDGDVKVTWDGHGADDDGGTDWCSASLLEFVPDRPEVEERPAMPEVHPGDESDEQSVPDDLVVDAQVLGVLSDEQQCRVTALHEARQVLAARHVFGSSAPSVWDLISAAEWILSGRGLTVEADDE